MWVTNNIVPWTRRKAAVSDLSLHVVVSIFNSWSIYKRL